ncbi:MAG TPA: hypothetical protein VHL58_19305 [Thermoanaerobaculia bacterium]|nr:hypothetical protein [Thermoanaerobaculia bacterium]
MRALGYILLAVAASASLMLVQVLKPTSPGATAVFSAWLLLPYVVLGLTLKFWAKDPASTNATVVVAAILAVGGFLFLADIMFLHPDPQGGIGVFFTPIYQGAGMLVLQPTFQWLFRRRKAC